MTSVEQLHLANWSDDVDEQYERIYSLLYREQPDEDYPGDFPRLRPWRRFAEFPFSYRIRNLIESADARIQGNGHPGLRSDAKLILLTNFRDMVAVPVAAHGEETGYLDSGLQADVDLLIDTAAATSLGKEPISAHAMVDTLSQNWDRLALAQIRLWGARRR
jgi:hypothetical protein